MFTTSQQLPVKLFTAQPVKQTKNYNNEKLIKVSKSTMGFMRSEGKPGRSFVFPFNGPL